MNPRQEIDGIIGDLMKRRKALCHLTPISDTPENKSLLEATQGDCQILATDEPEGVQNIDDVIERIEPLRETIIGQLQFLQTGSDPLKAEAAQRRIDADLAEARSILNGSFGMDSIQPVHKVTDADLQDWAAEELWYKAVAINRVVSSRVMNMPVAMQPEDMREAANRMQADTRSLLARTIGTEWQYKTTVKPIDWLIWCRNQGVDASPALWDAVNARMRQKKGEGLGDAYPEIAEADIRRITDLDAALYPSQYDAGLLGELDQGFGELLKNGWQPKQASKIIKAMICKGELLRDISAVELNLQSLDPAEQDYIERKERADRKLVELNKRLTSIMGQASDRTKRSPAQQRHVDLIEKVRELMQHELDTTWPEGQRGLKIHVIRQHYPELQRIYSRNASETTMAGKTQPQYLKNLGIKTPLPE